MYRGWSFGQTPDVFFWPNEKMSRRRHQLLLPWPKERKKTPQKTKKPKQQKKAQPFLNVRFSFFGGISQRVLIFQKRIFLWRGTISKVQFSMRLFFRGQCPVRTLFRNRGWIIFSGEWRGDNVLSYSFRDNSQWRQFSMGVIFIGVTLHEREFYRWAAIYLEISWWKFFKGQFSWRHTFVGNFPVFLFSTKWTEN